MKPARKKIRAIRLNQGKSGDQSLEEIDTIWLLCLRED